MTRALFLSDHVPNRTARCGAVQRHRTVTAAVRGFAQQRQQQGSQRRESSQEMSAVGACPVLSGRPAPRRSLSAVSTSIRACHAPAEAGRDQEDPHWSASDRRVGVLLFDIRLTVENEFRFMWVKTSKRYELLHVFRHPTQLRVISRNTCISLISNYCSQISRNGYGFLSSIQECPVWIQCPLIPNYIIICRHSYTYIIHFAKKNY